MVKVLPERQTKYQMTFMFDKLYFYKQFQMEQSRNDDKQQLQAEADLLRKQQIPQPIQSQLLDDYHLILSEAALSKQQLQDAIRMLYQRQQVYYIPEVFSSTLTAQIYTHSPTYQFVTLKVCYGYFQMLVSLLVEDKRSIINELTPIHNNPSASVFLFSSSTMDVAVKCFALKEYEGKAHFTKGSSKEDKALLQERRKLFGNVLREFCLLKVASGLGIGPQIVRLFGADIVLFHNSIAFSMEKCQNLQSVNTYISDNFQQELKKQLKLLHYFQIIHSDIKRDNLMFSSSRGELVFIDFGFAKVVDQTVGFKTLSSFSGTYEFCSMQMKKLYGNQNSQGKYTDLFYNDAHCLSVTFGTISKTQLSSQSGSTDPFQHLFENILNNNCIILNQLKHKNKSSHAYQNYQDYFGVLRLKWKIVIKQQKILEDKSNHYILRKYHSQFQSFLAQLPFYKELNQIYDFLIEELQKQKKDVAKLVTDRQSKRAGIFKFFNECKEQLQQRRRMFVNWFSLEQVSKIVLSSDYFNAVLIIQSNDKEELKRMRSVSQLLQNNCCTKLIKVIDIRSSKYSQQEKQDLAQQLIKCQKVDSYSSTNSSMEIVFRLILSKYIESPRRDFDVVVPASLINLVILNCLSDKELVYYVLKALKILGDGFKVGLMMIGLSEALTWVRSKKIQMKNQLQFLLLFQLKQAMKFKLDGAKGEQRQCLELFFQFLFEVNLQTGKPSQHFIYRIKKFILNSSHLGWYVVDEIMIMAMFKKEYHNSKNSKYVNVLNSFTTLFQCFPSIFQDTQSIGYIQIQLFQYIGSVKNDSLFISLFNRISNSLGKYFINFRAYDRFGCLKDSRDILQKRMHFLQTFDPKADPAQFNEFVSQCYEKFQFLSPQLHSLRSKLLSLINISLLEAVPFKQCLGKPPFQLHFCFMAVQKIILLLAKKQAFNEHIPYLLQYSDGIEKYIELGALQNVNQHKDSKDFLLMIRLFLLSQIYDKQFLLKGLQMCHKEMSILIQNRSRSVRSARTAADYDQDTIVWLINYLIYAGIRYADMEIGNYYIGEGYQAMKKLDYFHVDFLKVSKPNIETNSYSLTTYLLSRVGSIAQYLCYQKHLLLGLEQYPFKHYVTAYASTLSALIDSYFNVILQTDKVEAILTYYLFKWKDQFNCYSCLFLSFFLKILPKQFPFTIKLIIKMCCNLDGVSIRARQLARQNIFKFIILGNTSQHNLLFCLSQYPQALQLIDKYKLKAKPFIESVSLNEEVLNSSSSNICAFGRQKIRKRRWRVAKYLKYLDQGLSFLQLIDLLHFRVRYRRLKQSSQGKLLIAKLKTYNLKLK